MVLFSAEFLNRSNVKLKNTSDQISLIQHHRYFTLLHQDHRWKIFLILSKDSMWKVILNLSNELEPSFKNTLTAIISALYFLTYKTHLLSLNHSNFSHNMAVCSLVVQLKELSCQKTHKNLLKRNCLKSSKLQQKDKCSAVSSHQGCSVSLNMIILRIRVLRCNQLNS